jgi:hypothetical protein
MYEMPRREYPVEFKGLAVKWVVSGKRYRRWRESWGLVVPADAAQLGKGGGQGLAQSVGSAVTREQTELLRVRTRERPA